jgi:hypothetical protein
MNIKEINFDTEPLYEPSTPLKGLEYFTANPLGNILYFDALTENQLLQFSNDNYDAFLRWSKITECRFYFYYANNKVNEELGRAGKLTRFRRGTRSSNIFNQLPNGPLVGGKKPKNVRPYYDIAQQGWRSFSLKDGNKFFVLSAVRSVKTGKWVNNPNDFTTGVLGTSKDANIFWT